MEKQCISLNEIKTAIKSLNSKTKNDAHLISNRSLKELPNSDSENLLIIFNKSLKEHNIPTSWKSAHISMIPKKGDPLDIKNYRPISITPVLIRLFEKIILVRMQNFMEEKKF